MAVECEPNLRKGSVMTNTGWMGGRTKAAFLAVVAVSGVSASSPVPLMGQVVDAEARAAAETITVEDLQARLSVVAHDSMRGRATPSPELEETAAYIAREFASFGLRPGGPDGAWQQRFDLATIRAGDAAQHAAVIEGPGGSWELEFGTDYLAQHEAPSAEGTGEIFVHRVDGEPVDVTGRMVAVQVTLDNLQQVFGGGLGELIEGEPAGFLLSLDVPDEFMARLRGFLAGGRTVIGEPPESTVPVVYLMHSRLPAPIADLIAGEAGATGWDATLRTTATVETASAPNTIGVLEGSDPELADEYVVFTAHMDHLGVASDVEAGADSIHNGADDDGSGTVTIVELAEAFASLETRPRRSLLFMTVSGEERGLLGSRWYSENPVVPLEQTVANLNIDMIGRNWADTIVAIGQQESTLGPLVQSVSQAHPELNMAVIEDRWPQESFYTRSDHYNFARNGVPILFFFNGVHEDYHAVSDEVEKINYEKMSRIGRLIFYTGLAVADADERPLWDADAYARVVEDADEGADAGAAEGSGEDGGESAEGGDSR